MAKSMEKIKSALKLRTERREKSLTLRMGVKKHVLPFEVRLIESDEYVFVHVPPSAELMKVTPDGLKVVEDVEEAEKAVAGFRKSRRRSSRSAKEAELPDDIKNALGQIPPGFRLGYGPDGQPRLVKTRRRRKKTG